MCRLQRKERVKELWDVFKTEKTAAAYKALLKTEADAKKKFEKDVKSWKQECALPRHIFTCMLDPDIRICRGAGTEKTMTRMKTSMSMMMKKMLKSMTMMMRRMSRSKVRATPLPLPLPLPLPAPVT